MTLMGSLLWLCLMGVQPDQPPRPSVGMWGLSTVPPAALPAATPQSPSLSFNTLTVPARRWEMEIAGVLSDSTAAAPVFLKYGLTDRTEMEIGFDLIRTVEADADSVTSQGDLFLGVRSRLPIGGSSQSFAARGWLKAPTARDEAGTGEFDAGLIGIATLPFGRSSIDANLWLTALGQTGDAILGQVQGIMTLNLPERGGWSPFAEIAWERTATQGSDVFVDAGLGYAVSRTSAVNAAAGVGGGEGYPDWGLTVGWVVLFDEPK